MAALLALLLQLALTFGHVHLASAATVPLPQAATAVTGDTATLPQHGSDHDDDDYCALCAIAALLAAAQIPAPPVVPVSVTPAGAEVRSDFDHPPALARHSAFQSRAPPPA